MIIALRPVACVATVALIALSFCSPRERPETAAVNNRAQFRRIAETDFCSGRAVYSEPDRVHLVGTLGERYRKYEDPFTRQSIDAIHLRGFVNGRIASVWRPTATVRLWYVQNRGQDACTWIEKDEVMSSTPLEVAPSEALILTGQGQWKTRRGFPE